MHYNVNLMHLTNPLLFFIIIVELLF